MLTLTLYGQQMGVYYSMVHVKAILSVSNECTPHSAIEIIASLELLLLAIGKYYRPQVRATNALLCAF